MQVLLQTLLRNGLPAVEKKTTHDVCRASFSRVAQRSVSHASRRPAQVPAACGFIIAIDVCVLILEISRGDAFVLRWVQARCLAAR